MIVRYDKDRAIYRDCRFCGGTGCLACPGEAEKAFHAAFPDGPKPIATFKPGDPRELERMKKAIGKDALDKAFGPNGGGVSEIIDNLTIQKE